MRMSALCDKQKIALWLRGGRVFNRMMPSRQNLDEPFPSAERRETICFPVLRLMKTGGLRPKASALAQSRPDALSVSN